MGLGVVCSSVGVPVGAWATQGGISFKTSEAGVPVGAWATQGGISFKTSEVGAPVGAWATQGGISFKTSEAGGVRGGLKGFPPCVHLNGRHSSPANQAKSLASLISVSGLPLAGPVSFVATAMPRTQSASISLRAVGGEHRSVLATSLVVRMPPLSINVRKTFARIVGALSKVTSKMREGPGSRDEG